MKNGWRSFEAKVREVATLIWNKEPKSERIGGVQIDAVIHLDAQESILIEITEERNLGKIREDVTKIVTAQNELFAKRIISRSFCVVSADSLTEGMIGAGLAVQVKVITFKDFAKIFFNFENYRLSRLRAPFGSAVDPITGANDDSQYVPVRYSVDGSDSELSTKDIAEILRGGKNIILLGEYGSGKSRCIRETFIYMAARASENFCHPVAIDLREAWGLKRGAELFQRHFTDLGLEGISGSATRALNAGAIVILLDGFDELGSQAWNNDPARLRTIRAHAMQGVKDVITRSKGGVLVAGREHYFPTNEEMFHALGINGEDCLIVRSKEEFTDEELQEFFDQRGLDVEIPRWLPRRPLICQTINNLPEEDRAEMFNAGASETAFWDHFMKVLCVRDSRIHVAFDPDAIFGVLKRLARITRTKPSNVGPVTLLDMQRAFEEAVGQTPGEEASVMLQRLPSLGRLGSESDDRQFTDTYILDGLRAKDVGEIALSSVETLREVLAVPWVNGLDRLGQRILASDAKCSDNKLLLLAQTASDSANKILASDAISSILSRNSVRMDFSGLNVKGVEFVSLDLSIRECSNLSIEDCVFSNLIFGNKEIRNVRISRSAAGRVIGVTSIKGLPSWASITVDRFESVDNTASIKRIGLTPAQQMLVTILRKTFFQKGAGRKEEALTRGFARIGNPGLVTKVINLLIREQMLEVAKGKEGNLYIPIRKNSGRARRILESLSLSKDRLWDDVSGV